MLLLFGGLCAVALLAAVASGHPDGLYGFAVGHAHQVALGTVDGASSLDDLRQANGVAFGLHRLAESEGERCDLVQTVRALTVKGFAELSGAISRLLQAGHQTG